MGRAARESGPEGVWAGQTGLIAPLLPFVRDQGDVQGGCPKNRFMSTPDGEPVLNYLCAGYRRFFTHCRPFVSQVAALWRQQAP